MRTYAFGWHAEVVAGPTSAQSLSDAVTALGIYRPLVVTGREPQLIATAEKLVRSVRSAAVFSGVRSGPQGDDVDQLSAAVQEAKADGCIAVGGGSVLDAAALAVQAVTYACADPSRAEPEHAFARRKALPIIALPTTAGSGAEMACEAWVRRDRTVRRVALAERAPRRVFLDPLLAESLSPGVVRFSGIELIAQAIEGVFSRTANPFTDALHLEAIRLASAALPSATKSARTTWAVQRMLEAATMVGVARQGSGAGPADAVARALLGQADVPYAAGLTMAILPRFRLAVKEAPVRGRRIADALGLSVHRTIDEAAAEAAVSEFERLLREVGALGVRLSDYAVTSDDLDRVRELALAEAIGDEETEDAGVLELTDRLREAL